LTGVVPGPLDGEERRLEELLVGVLLANVLLRKVVLEELLANPLMASFKVLGDEPRLVNERLVLRKVRKGV
jgi:hypothetical protein